MSRYLISAFWHRERIPLLGELPVNVLAVAVFAAVGFGHPAVWWLGGGLEAAFLVLLSGHTRFRRLVDARRRMARTPAPPEGMAELRASLTPASAARHARLEERLARIREWYQDAAGSDTLDAGQHRSMDHLAWLHLKLLLAGDQLERSRAEADEAGLESRIAAVESGLAGELSAPARRSMEASLTILQERLATARHRHECLAEIGADLARIEDKVELSLEKATLHAHPTGLCFTIDLAGSSLDSGAPAEFSGRRSIREMDARFAAPPAARQR